MNPENKSKIFNYLLFFVFIIFLLIISLFEISPKKSIAEGESWQYLGQPTFSTGSVAYTSIAIDATGTPYVVYRDHGNNQKATVMKYNGSEWVNVGNAGFSAGSVNSTFIALDSSGTPYVVYGDWGNSGKATVKKYNGSLWEDVGSPGFSAGRVDNTSIAIDATGTPYVVYQDYGNNQKATVMKYDGSSWINVGNAGFSTGSVGDTSIAIDATGTPYVVYRDVINRHKATVMKYTSETLWRPSSYEIDSIQDLYNIRNDLFGIYSLTKDLDFNDINSYDETIPAGYSSVAEFKTAMTSDSGWIPIRGTSNDCFAGTFNGDIYKISNLYIKTNQDNNIGLFGYACGASTLTNVHLEGTDITSTYDSTYNYSVGGLVGINCGTISNSYFAGSVKATGDRDYVGGLVGYNYYGTVSNSYSMGSVSGIWDYVGGLVGYNYYGTVSNSYSMGSVSGTNYVGGLVGDNPYGTVSNSYSMGSVSGTNYVGGLAGSNYRGVISNSYSTGSVSGTSNIGGLAGYNRIGTISNSYYNSETSGQSDNDGRGLPRTTAEMTYPYDVTSATTYVGWDFDNIWYHDINHLVNNGYPVNYWIDNVNPTITILGSNPASVFKGSSYTDEGATAVDDIDGDITNNIIVTNNVNTSNIGIYSVIYEVSDTVGNTVSSTRIVNVVSAPGSTIPPYILESMNNNQNTNTSTSTEQSNEQQSNNENNNQTSELNFWTDGKFIKLKEKDTVYFVDSSNIKHAYPDRGTWESYFEDDFSRVKIVSKQEFDSYLTGDNVPHKTGSLIKTPESPKIYKVTDNKILRWIINENVAERLFGKTWNKLIRDISAIFFKDYTIGENIE
jgi:hypothetical protein